MSYGGYGGYGGGANGYGGANGARNGGYTNGFATSVHRDDLSSLT